MLSRPRLYRIALGEIPSCRFDASQWELWNWGKCEMLMSKNAKNQLQELLDNLGCAGNCIDFRSTPLADLHCSTVTVTFPDGRIVRGTGKGHRKSDADIAAAQDALVSYELFSSES